VDDAGFKNKPQKISAPAGFSKHGAKILWKILKLNIKLELGLQTWMLQTGFKTRWDMVDMTMDRKPPEKQIFLLH
jgi:hypothetical protein